MAKFVESEALLALLSDDNEAAQDFVDTMLPRELRELQGAARLLDSMCADALQRKRQEQPVVS